MRDPHAVMRIASAASTRAEGLRIGIAPRWLDSEQPTGIGNYIHNLLANLAQIDPANSYVLYIDQAEPARSLRWPLNFNLRRVWCPVMWTPVGMSLELLFHERPDIILFPNHTIPLYHPCKTVATVFDVGFVHFRAYETLRTLLHRVKQTEYAVKNADRIIAISNSTKHDLVKVYKVNPDKITVVYLGCGESFRPPRSDEIKRVRAKYFVDKRYIIYAGTIHPRKNVGRLLDAYRRLVHQTSPSNCHQLVLVGHHVRPYKDYGYSLVRQLSITEKVVFTGYVPQDDLVALIGGADAFVFPTLFEGFGLPALEAMACGTPVIASNTSSLPEVVGDAGILVDPYDVDGLAAAIQRVVTDEELRQTMHRKSLERAKMFSWEKTARETLQVLMSAAQQAG